MNQLDKFAFRCGCGCGWKCSPTRGNTITHLYQNMDLLRWPKIIFFWSTAQGNFTPHQTRPHYKGPQLGLAMLLPLSLLLTKDLSTLWKDKNTLNEQFFPRVSLGTVAFNFPHIPHTPGSKYWPCSEAVNLSSSSSLLNQKFKPLHHWCINKIYTRHQRCCDVYGGHRYRNLKPVAREILPIFIRIST